eukprot:CAMPEP_0179197054 /NCGR_PEP_ID=MMETSP0796-20121207/97991_1 /TAXON_ID=73915 /ORGANISM="Pyrodinium bahamense, Strain pbaha01" /LENGTH=286 /DNA_ID=CAMNT_0020901471 /DNA_START=21 /DNA_END=881 /DNA_ORIENTATION=+
MGRHKKVPRKGLSRQQKKKKFRPQDPFYRGPKAPEDPKFNRPPGKDEDILDVPEVSGGNSMFGGGPATGSQAAGGDDDGLSARARRRLRARERKKAAAAAGGADLEAGEEEAGAGVNGEKRREPERASVGGKPPTLSAADLPKQRPGESRWSYNRRLNAALKQHMEATRRKTVTEHRREKRRQRAADVKDRRAAKRASAKKATEESAELGRMERVEFGDVAERPPILGPAALKSRTKLKKASSTGSVGDTGKGAPHAAADADLEDYAQRVRDAYAEMKRRRLAGAA